jgi:SnoaL-like polyketide cyclase
MEPGGASCFTNRGTNIGPFLNRPPAGKHAEWLGICIYTVRRGRITEGWSAEDILDMLMQLDDWSPRQPRSLRRSHDGTGRCTSPRPLLPPPDELVQMQAEPDRCDESERSERGHVHRGQGERRERNRRDQPSSPRPAIHAPAKRNERPRRER